MAIDINNLSPEQVRQLQQAMTPRVNKFIPIKPTPKQTAALLMNNTKELLYGGAAGGGKSVYLLAAALQYVDVPEYSAILFRKTFSDLMLPGALIPMAHSWLQPWVEKGLVTWRDKEKRFTFLETDATLSFGYLDAKGDEYRYQGAEFQFVGMDETTQIAPEAYRYLFSRLRRKKGVQIPIRMRATTNPGGTYGDYYYERFFVDNKKQDGSLKRIFLQAGLADNPHLDEAAYREALAELDPITRAQLEDGNWEIRPRGDIFDRNWLIPIEPAEIPSHVKWVRYWDLASIDPKYRKKNTNKKEPDWTVGFKLGMSMGIYYIADIIKVQMKPGDVEDLVQSTAMADGYSCAVRMEEEGGSSGIANTERYSKLLMSYDYVGVKSVTSKIERARPVAAACQVGNMFVSKHCRNMLDLYTQLDAFPNGINDDIVDGFSGAFAYFKPNVHRIDRPPQAKKEEYYRRMSFEGSYWRGNDMSNY